MWSEPNSRRGAVVLQRLSKNAAKAKMMMRKRAEPAMMSWVFVKWTYIAFSIALKVRNDKMDIAAVGIHKDCEGWRPNETVQK